MTRGRIFPILDRPTILFNDSKEFVRVPFYIEFDLTNLTKWGEEKLEELKRPIFEWHNHWEEEGKAVDIINIEEKYSEWLGETHLDEMIMKVKPKPIGVSYQQFKDLVDRVEMNPRNIKIREGVVIEFLNIHEDYIFDELESTVQSWEDKWSSGRNPFRVDIQREKDRVLVDVEPYKKFTAYQLVDLFDKLPSVKANIW